MRRIVRPLTALLIAVLIGAAAWLGRPQGDTAADPAKAASHRPARSAAAHVPATPSARHGGGILRDASGSAPAAKRRRAAPRPTATRVAPTATPPASPKYVVLIVLDGARPDFFNVTGIPHVRSLMQHGTFYPNAWAGILESETPSGHATITTGSQPRRDGILSFDWANSDNIPINLFDEAKIRSGQMEGYMRQAAAPSIAGLLHRSNHNAKVVALSGYKYYAADAIGGPNADVIMYFNSRKNGSFGPTGVPGHMPPASVVNDPSLVLKSRSYPLGGGNRLAMKLAARTFEKMHQQVTLINLPEFDWPLGHVDGSVRDQKTLGLLMRGFDADLAALEETYRKQGALDQTLFILTSDHGFAPIDHKIDHSIVNDAVAAAGTSIIRDTYHTASYVWLKDEAKSADVAERIAHLQNPYIKAVYFRTTGADGPHYLRASGTDLFRTPGLENANQYLLDTFNGPNGPDVVVLLAEHTMFTAGAENTWKGDHGGSSWQSQNLALVMSGPGVRHGRISDYPAPLIDLAPTLLHLMGLHATGMQGIPLADAMQAPSAAEVSWQHAQGAVLRPVVNALHAESKADLAAGK